MIKTLALSSLVFTLCVLAISYEDAFAAPCVPGDTCQAQIRLGDNNITGLEYELDSPDLYIDRNACSDIAVSTGWLFADIRFLNTIPEWVESGITKGELRMGGVGDRECITKLSTYYAVQNVDNTDRVLYIEYVVPGGRVDPGEDVTVTIEEQVPNSIAVTVSTPNLIKYPARVSLDPLSVFNVRIGIEGTVSAVDDYSSIPLSKFTNMKIKQNNVWINLPSSATVFDDDADQGYLGEKCDRDNSFVAGSVTQIDCNVIAVRNQIPTITQVNPIEPSSTVFPNMTNRSN